MESPGVKNIPLKKTEKKEKNYKEGEVLVRYKDKEKLDRKIERINEGQGKRKTAGIKKEIGDTKVVLVRSEEKTTEELIDEFKGDESVEYVEPNYRRELAHIPNDTYFGYQWSHRNTGQSVGGIAGTPDADADITEAWDIEESDAGETILAVIDSGVRYSYADLSGNMWDGSVCFDKNNDLVAGGCPNHGWDYYDGDNDPDDSASSSQGHGTFIAGIIGSETGNSSGIAGISRYNNIKIMALRFDLYVDTEVEAINFAKNNGAKVINASFTGEDYSLSEELAIEAFDGVFVAASGNDGANNDSIHQYPCDYDSTNLICVGASDQNDAIASFSNYSTTSVDLTAPGKNITSYGYCDPADPECDGGGWGFYWIGGTSFATPFVAGTAGLLYAHNDTLTTTQVKNLILDSVDAKAGLASYVATGGRLNVYKSLNYLIGSSDPITQPVYRFYSQNNRSHFFTISETEKNRIISTYPEEEWRYEGIAWYVPTTSSGNSPVYRFYSQNNRSHFFTISETEKNRIISTYPEEEWRYEGIAWYVPTTSSGNSPVYRFYSQNNRSHFFTISETEKNRIISTYPTEEWNYEGIAYYVPE